jgi:type 1 glutamine amidotransferase
VVAVRALALALLLLQARDEVPERRLRQIREAAPAKATAAPKKPRRVLVWTTPAHLMEKDPHKGYCIPYGTAAWKALGEKSGAYEPVVRGDLAVFLPESLKTFDAVVLNNASGPWITPTEEDLRKEPFAKLGLDKAGVEEVLRKSLLDWLSEGGGIAATHFAMAANRQWPGFGEIFGAGYDGHPWNEEVGVKIDDPAHPLTASFGSKPFRVADEIYQFRAPYSREKLRVLLSIDPAGTNMGVKFLNRKDGDFALAWIRAHGKGRVFYTTLGHRTEIYWNPQVLRFYLDGVQYAAGDLDADASPR